MRMPIRVAAALVFDAGRLLITRRPAGKHLGGFWEFPGGKLEEGESFQDCLQRELREELGIQVRVGELLAAVEHNYPEQTLQIHFYRCALDSGTPSPIECDAVEWITPSMLNDYAFPPADAGVLAEIQSRPELWDAET